MNCVVTDVVSVKCGWHEMERDIFDLFRAFFVDARNDGFLEAVFLHEAEQ